MDDGKINKLEEMPNNLQFLQFVSKLKHLDRQGWLRHGIKRPETVAGHMYRMAIMSGFVVDDPTLDLNRCIKLSIIHDIGESIIGDITPHDNVSNENKNQLETAAIEKLAGIVGTSQGDEIRQLFHEYENGTTREGKVVKDLDKFDMLLQAYEYEISEGKPKFLEEFFSSTEGYFQNPQCHPKVKEMYLQLLNAREKCIKFPK